MEEQYLLISHSDREEYALRLQKLLQERLLAKQVLVSDVFCGCGTNAGPGMVGVYFLGEPISDDCAKEKEILAQALAEA